MTKLQTVISKFEALPIEQQDKLAEFLNDLMLTSEGDFTFSDTERAEIKQLLKTDTASYTHEEVFTELVTPDEDDFFELTDEESAELDRRLKNINNEPTYTHAEAMNLLRTKYAADIGAQ
jgi:glutamine cyclotransferase